MWFFKDVFKSMISNPPEFRIFFIFFTVHLFFLSWPSWLFAWLKYGAHNNTAWCLQQRFNFEFISNWDLLWLPFQNYSKKKAQKWRVQSSCHGFLANLIWSHSETLSMKLYLVNISFTLKVNKLFIYQPSYQKHLRLIETDINIYTKSAYAFVDQPKYVYIPIKTIRSCYSAATYKICAFCNKCL